MDFFYLLPGAAGGRALAQQRGGEYFSEIARTAAALRTDEERRAIARKGAQSRRHRRLHTPRTVTVEAGGIRLVERVIPYYPLLKGKTRRTKPEFVRIEVACEELPPRDTIQCFILEESNRYGGATAY